jgi:hypothetical protein
MMKTGVVIACLLTFAVMLAAAGRGQDARATAGGTPALRIEIELANVERANLVPEI